MKAKYFLILFICRIMRFQRRRHSKTDERCGSEIIADADANGVTEDLNEKRKSWRLNECNKLSDGKEYGRGSS